VTYPLSILAFLLLLGAVYVLIGRKRTPREYVGFALGFAAVLPLLDGSLTLVQESARLQDGVVVPGVVTGKLSSTGAEGTRTIGRRRRWRRSPTINTITGFRAHEMLARWIVFGSRHAWVVEYRYPCELPRGCSEREFVSGALWSELHEGEVVNVRAAKGLAGSGRLGENSMLAIGLAEFGIGAVIALVAAAVSGRWTWRRRRKYVAVPAVVTSVEPIQAGDKVHWRVGYAYFAADGVAYQCADDVYVPGLKPGDDGTAVYPSESPDLGTFRWEARAS
jgi:hypothetical protein